MWTYRAKLIGVIDGDTIDLRVDLGFRLEGYIRVRLLGVNTYELHDPDPAVRLKAIEGKNYVGALYQISGDWPITIRTEKADAFGRWLADVTFIDRDGRERNINHELLASGLGVPWKRKS